MKNITTVALLLALTVHLVSCEKDTASFSAAPQGKGGSTARFAVEGNFLYTVDESRLSTYDLTNPADPRQVHSQEVGFEIETIFPFGGRLFIGSTSVIHIFDLADPAKPQKLSTAISPTVMRRCDPVVAKDTAAFATLRSGTECGGVQSILAVFDIKDITKPVQRFSYTLQQPRGLAYADTILYVCDPPGLHLFNIKNAWQPQHIKTLSDGDFFDVIPYGNLLFGWTSTGATIYDITQPASPAKLSTIQ